MPKASTKLQGFLREYCISLHLSHHPCIVGLFGIAFQSQEHYCFAQELVIGRDLFAVIQPKVSHSLSKWDLRRTWNHVSRAIVLDLDAVNFEVNANGYLTLF